MPIAPGGADAPLTMRPKIAFAPAEAFFSESSSSRIARQR
jgi:hypothetical protein